jgi:hypothetical protein
MGKISDALLAFCQLPAYLTGMRRRNMTCSSRVDLAVYCLRPRDTKQARRSILHPIDGGSKRP